MAGHREHREFRFADKFEIAIEIGIEDLWIRYLISGT
jgi:hypothetical protein